MPPITRREALVELCGHKPDILQDNPLDYLDLADVMIEQAVGIMGVPLGIATGFLIDGREYAVPMATEEPSVIAAASYAAGIIRLGGGFETSATEPLMTCQIFFHRTASFDLSAWTADHLPAVQEQARTALASLESRGGGFRDIRISTDGTVPWLRIEIDANVGDAMGANRLNTTGEAVAAFVEQHTGIRRIMAVLTNASEKKRARAAFSLSVEQLSRVRGGGPDTAVRIVLADQIAHADPGRAVTHNKGIMNGVSALALASGNDTRAVEAAVHSWAARSGSYKALTDYTVDNGCLNACLEIPTAFATAGGATAFHPTARASMAILENPGATELSRIAAALGLAQNFAALLALTGEGIQKGHMEKHARKTAYIAGARGPAIQAVAAEMARRKAYSLADAAGILNETDTPGTAAGEI